jgi:hypothetical protein
MAMKMKGIIPQKQKIIFTAIAGLLLIFSVAVFLIWLSTKFAFIEDLTQNNRHSLSTVSVDLLRQIEDPVLITAYARQDTELRGAISQFIEKYQNIKPDIILKFIDPDTSPERIRELGIRVNGELVFEYQGRVEHVRSADENTIVNTFAKLLQDKKSWVGFLHGHGERDLLGRANHDLGGFGFQLKNRGYFVQPVNLAEIPDIPDNTSILVMAGQRLPLLESEISSILDYLDGGGNFLWLLDPGDQENLPQILLRYFEIELARGTVIDTAGQLIGIDDPTVAIITSSLYTPHPLLENFSYTTIYPHAAALLPGDSKTWTSTPLLMTGNQAWVESSPLENEIVFDATMDLQGPLTIGLALTRTISDDYPESEHEQRVIIVGDGDFISNTYLENSGNLDLGIRMFSWLGYQENLIEIPVRTLSDMNLTVSTYVIGTIGIFFLVIMPLISMTIGIIIWRNTRIG